MGWMAAVPIASAVLGGLGGKNKSKSQNTKYSKNILPPTQLGGWGRLNEIMRGLGTAPQYRPGQNNPYLAAGMSQIFNRAGIQGPMEGGGFGNPYLNPPPQIAAASTPAPTPTPQPTPRPGLIGAKKKQRELMKDIG